MKKKYLGIVSIFVSLLLADFVFGADAKEANPPVAQENAVKQKTKPRAEMTKAEIIETIQDVLDSEDEALDFIPDIKKRKDKDGKEFYVYLSESKEMKLEDLDREKLDKILTRVNQTAVRIRTERIQRQLESIQQAQNIQRMQNIQNMQNIQRVQTNVQRVPLPPPQPPKAPQLPPAPPKK